MRSPHPRPPSLAPSRFSLHLSHSLPPPSARSRALARVALARSLSHARHSLTIATIDRARARDRRFSARAPRSSTTPSRSNAIEARSIAGELAIASLSSIKALRRSIAIESCARAFGETRRRAVTRSICDGDELGSFERRVRRLVRDSKSGVKRSIDGDRERRKGVE